MENKRNINKVDLSNMDSQELIENHFNDSIAKLRPLLNKINATDDLINIIVYKLYVLTNEEISIVEG